VADPWIASLRSQRRSSGRSASNRNHSSPSSSRALFRAAIKYREADCRRSDGSESCLSDTLRAAAYSAGGTWGAAYDGGDRDTPANPTSWGDPGQARDRQNAIAIGSDFAVVAADCSSPISLPDVGLPGGRWRMRARTGTAEPEEAHAAGVNPPGHARIMRLVRDGPTSRMA
jgi:hypothetical protein